MAKKDLSKFLGNNKKYSNNAIVLTVTPAFLKESDVKTGDQVILGMLPANVLVTGAYLVVAEAMTGFSLNVNVNGATDNLDLSTPCATLQSSITVGRTKAPTNITATVTMGSATTGEAHLVVEFIELNGYNGTFVG